MLIIWIFELRLCVLWLSILCRVASPPPPHNCVNTRFLFSFRLINWVRVCVCMWIVFCHIYFYSCCCWWWWYCPSDHILAKWFWFSKMFGRLLFILWFQRNTITICYIQSCMLVLFGYLLLLLGLLIN